MADQSRSKNGEYASFVKRRTSFRKTAPRYQAAGIEIIDVTWARVLIVDVGESVTPTILGRTALKQAEMKLAFHMRSDSIRTRVQ